jgi:hypothetical protein
LIGFSCTTSYSCSQNTNITEGQFLTSWNAITNTDVLDFNLSSNPEDLVVGTDGNSLGGFSFNGKIQPNSVLNLFIFGNLLFKSTFSDANGDWSITIDQPIATDNYDLFAVTVAGGVETRNSEVLSLSVDAVSKTVSLGVNSFLSAPPSDNVIAEPSITLKPDSTGTSTSPAWICVVLILVVVFLAVFILFFIKKKKKDTDQTTTVEGGTNTSAQEIPAQGSVDSINKPVLVSGSTGPMTQSLTGSGSADTITPAIPVTESVVTTTQPIPFTGSSDTISQAIQPTENVVTTTQPMSFTESAGIKTQSTPFMESPGTMTQPILVTGSPFSPPSETADQVVTPVSAVDSGSVVGQQVQELQGENSTDS